MPAVPEISQPLADKHTNRGKSQHQASHWQAGAATGSNTAKTKKAIAVEVKDTQPQSEKGQFFLELQEKIRESVLRADQSLLAYEIKETVAEKQEQAVLEGLPPSPHHTPLPENLDEIIPASEKLAMLNLNTHHEQSMVRLVNMYNSLNGELSADMLHVSSHIPSEDVVLRLLDEVAEHRNNVIEKVNKAKERALLNTSLIQQASTQKEEIQIDVKELVTDNSNITGMRDIIKMLESRVQALENELEDEHKARHDLIEEKDRTIERLKDQVKTQNEETAGILEKTAGDLADSAERVEDTRLHIAYLSIQLRNAKELAESRTFDADKWVLRTDHEALQVDTCMHIPMI